MTSQLAQATRAVSGLVVCFTDSELSCERSAVLICSRESAPATLASGHPACSIGLFAPSILARIALLGSLCKRTPRRQRGRGPPSEDKAPGASPAERQLSGRGCTDRAVTGGGHGPGMVFCLVRGRRWTPFGAWYHCWCTESGEQLGHVPAHRGDVGIGGPTHRVDTWAAILSA